MVLGFDIGGTKCAVIAAMADGESITLLDKKKIPTDLGITPEQMIEKLISLAAKALGLKTIGLTGKTGGRLKEICDICICVPEKETFKVQEFIFLYITICVHMQKRNYYHVNRKVESL